MQLVYLTSRWNQKFRKLLSSDSSFARPSPGIGIVRRPVMERVVFVSSRCGDTVEGLTAATCPSTSKRSFATRSFRVSACASSSSAALALSSALAELLSGDLVHLGDGRVDLFYTLSLLTSSGSNFCD